jgi:hypothetical protein
MPAFDSQQIFARAVRGDLPGDDLGAVQPEGCVKKGAETLGEIGHRREIADAAPIKPAP